MLYDCGYNKSEPEISETRSNFNYLLWTEAEIDSARINLERAGIEVRSIKGKQASERNFRIITKTSQPIIHIATHGIFLKRKEYLNDTMDWYDVYKFCMENTGILFSCADDAKQSDNDGFLSAEEIMQLDLSGTELLVLSACKSGLGMQTPYGLAGLIRALKKAGVSTIVVSWNDLDDFLASQFMAYFYKYLSTGENVRTAFYKADEDMINGGFGQDDYYNPFIIVD